MKTLLRKIKTVIKNDSENFSGTIYLTADELIALVNMRKVKYFNKDCSIDRFLSLEGDRYVEGHNTIKISRKQAQEVCNDFEKYNEFKGAKTFARVYISTWQGNGYYISF